MSTSFLPEQDVTWSLRELAQQLRVDSVRGWVPFAATLAAFLARAYDFIRMAAVSQASIRLVGSHCGAAVGADGPSQMGLEDVAALRAAARDTGRIVTAEDHWPEGGLGDAVLGVLAAGGQPLPVVTKLAVWGMPGSATPEEQLQLTGIDVASIATAAVRLVAH